MLLDPFEEQFDLPTTLVQFGDGECRQGKVVGEEHQFFAGFCIVIPDSTQGVGIALGRVEAGQYAGLVATQSGGLVHLPRVAAMELEIGFGPDNEEGRSQREPIQSLEVEVGAVHDIECAGLRQQGIEHLDVVQFAR